MAGFPIVIVARAISHLVFACLGAYFLTKYPHYLQTTGRKAFFSLSINFIHALAEVCIVYLLTATDATNVSYWHTLLVLVGLGTLLHGCVDFFIALYVWKLATKQNH